MKIGNKNLLLHLIILLLNLYIGGVKLEVVKDEKDLLNIISSNIKILEINVENEINITNNINVNSFEKVIISGGSTENSILNFLDLSHYLYFDNGVKEIQLNNLSIRGNLYFHDNLKINIQNVHLTGNINSKFDIRNEYINISNFKYESSSNESDNCINLRGGNVNINNSTFFGSSSCQNRLINYNGNGDDKYNLIIKDSYFSGEYQCPILDIINGFNIDINNSIFEKAYSSESIEGGSVMHALNSYVYIKNCTLKDNLSSEKGGAFYLYDLYDFEADHLDIFNTTSLKLGSMSYISTSENINSIAKFTNIKQIDTGNILGMTNGGLIMGLEKSSNVLIDKYYAENLINPYETACAFILSEHAALTMSNIEIDTIQGKGDDGLFVYTLNGYGINVSATNVLINNGRLLGIRETSVIWISNNSHATFDNIIIKNISGYLTNIVYQENESVLYLNNLNVENFHSKTAIELFNYNGFINGYGMTINNLKMNNIYSRGVLFRTEKGNMALYNSEINNIHKCYMDNSCDTDITVNQFVYSSEIALLGSGSNLEVNNTIFNNIYGDVGVHVTFGGKITFNNSTISNCYFDNGFIRIDEMNNIIGYYIINNSYFKNIKSNYGSVIHIDSLDKNEKIPFDITNSIFENNVAKKYGGVIYSISPYTNNILSLKNCIFNNNTALLGKIVYSYNLKSEPYFTNKQSLKKIKGNFATNPTKLILNNELNEGISIYSGEMLPEGISASLYDDYNNLILFDTDILNIQFERFMFYNIEISDEYNAILLGQSKSYCWGDSCEFPPIKIVGNPGEYYLRLKINTFGQFSKFEKNYIDIKINIKSCTNTTLLNQYLDSPRFKSCYQPYCEPSCNKGKCVNFNLCNCTDTLYTGSHCDQYYQLNRMPIIFNIIRFLTSILMGITIMISIAIIMLKNNPTIKGGSVDFLLLILIGLLINYVYIYLLTIENTKTTCIFIYLFNNIGFSLVFGSILVKTLRIYKIFNVVSHRNKGLRIEIMYAIVFSLVLFYISVVVVSVKNNWIDNKSSLTNDLKEFKKCVYPKFMTLCTLLNFIVLFIGCILSYSIRNVKKDFRENLNIPVYIYVTSVTLIEIVNGNDGISIVVQNLFRCIGTIINTFVILYYLYIDKLNTVYYTLKLEKNQPYNKSISQPIRIVFK